MTHVGNWSITMESISFIAGMAKLMSSIMKSCFITLVVVFCLPANAQTNLSCTPSTIVNFTNGVNVDRVKAEGHTRLIKRAYESYSNTEFDLAYNNSRGYFFDVAEAVGQLALGIQPADVTAHVDTYTNDLEEGNRLVLIGHSQGTLFVNEAYAALPANLRPSVGLISIATPRSSIETGRYHTARDDRVINAVRILSPATLQGNVNNDLSRFSDILAGMDMDRRDFINHEFWRGYFHPGLPSRSRIDADMRNYIGPSGSLQSPTQTLQGGAITVRLDWGSEPDVDLHVYEPNGSQVYYNNLRGRSGRLDRDDINGEGPEHYYVSCDDIEVGNYVIGVNYFRGDDPETARIRVTAGGNSRAFSRRLTTERGSGGDSTPIIIATVRVTRDSTGGYAFDIRSGGTRPAALATLAVTSEGKGGFPDDTAEPIKVAGITAAPSRIIESGGESTVTIRLNRPAETGGFAVALQYSGNASDDDYDAPATLTIPEKQHSATLTLRAKNDTIGEEDETVIIRAGGVSATLTIADDDRGITDALHRQILGHVAQTAAQRALNVVENRMSASKQNSFTLNGENSAMALMQKHGLAIAERRFRAKQLINGSGFSMPLTVMGDSNTSIWGHSNLHNFGASGISGGAYHGENFNVQFGTDSRIGSTMLLGTAMEWSETGLDITEGDRESQYTLQLNTLNPYAAWSSLGAGVNVWTMLTRGTGELKTRFGGIDSVSKVKTMGAGAGIKGNLLQRGANTVTAKGNVLQTQSEITGSADRRINALETSTALLRGVVIASHNRQLTQDVSVAFSAESGIRYDNSEHRDNKQMETRVAAKRSSDSLRLTLEGHMWSLHNWKSDHNTWGIGSSLRLRSNLDGQGMSLRLAPSYGDTSQRTAGLLWQDSDTDSDYRTQMEVHFGYGIRLIGANSGLLTPYFSVSKSNTDNYRLGLRWEGGQGLDVALSGERRQLNDHFENTWAIKGRLQL